MHFFASAESVLLKNILLKAHDRSFWSKNLTNTTYEESLRMNVDKSMLFFEIFDNLV